MGGEQQVVLVCVARSRYRGTGDMLPQENVNSQAGSRIFMTTLLTVFLSVMACFYL